jgi:hypothetical protein
MLVGGNGSGSSSPSLCLNNATLPCQRLPTIQELV